MALKLIIVVGYSGAGKTTLSGIVAKECDFLVLSEDEFVFDMIPHTLIKRALRPEDRALGMKNLWGCMENGLKSGKSVIVEGALVDGPFVLEDYKKLARRYQADFVPILLCGAASVRRIRGIKRGYAVTSAQDKRLMACAKKLGYFENCTAIDTTKISRKRAVAEIKRIAGI